MNTERVYLGTWQFDSLQHAQIQELIQTAQSEGIHGFDTAAVYAGGAAESYLGQFTNPQHDFVVTKAPAISKQETNPLLAYSDDHLAHSLDGSIDRLGRAPDVALLHNWHADWEVNGGTQLLSRFRTLASQRAINLIGISLPNNYSGVIEQSDAYELLDYLELPYNDELPAITIDRIATIAQSKKVLVRSLFKHGADISNMAEKFSDVLETGATVVVGASRPQQIKDWSQM